MNSTPIRAAGGVLWRATGVGVEVAIVHRPRYDDWSLPKGKLRTGEHPLRAACREVVEETGLTPAVQHRLPTQEYQLGPDRKTVDYWAMAVDSGDFVPNEEVDELRWVGPDEADTTLSYDRDRDLTRLFLRRPVIDTTVLLVRHAKAGSRSGWPGDDRLRPLEPAGEQQAEGLRTALACFQPARLHAADLVRCRQTLAPLAQDLHLPVETEPTLAEDAYADKPELGYRRLREVATAAVRAAICSQGGVIPDLIGRLADADRLPLGRLKKVPARKGSVWSLSFVDGRLTAADYYADLA